MKLGCNHAVINILLLLFLSHSVRSLQTMTSGGKISRGVGDVSLEFGSTTAWTKRPESRRLFIGAAAFTLSSIIPFKAQATENINELLVELKKARSQLEPIPDLIQKEQWDSVRAILITPPLSNLWTKSARKIPLLQEYADVIGENNGDELAALEGKEELMSSLRVSVYQEPRQNMPMEQNTFSNCFHNYSCFISKESGYGGLQ